MEKIKVLLVSKSIDGGTGTYIENLLKLKKEFKFAVLTLENPSYRKFPYKFSFFAPHGYYPALYKLQFKNILSFVKEIYWLRKKIKEIKPEIILSVDIHANLLSMINKLFFYPTTSVILTSHSGFSNSILEKSSKLLGFFLKVCASFFYRKANLVISVSKGVAKEIRSTLFLNKTPIVIHNGIPLKKQFALTPLKKNAPVFLVVSRLNKQKDLETIFRAFSKVLKKIPLATLLIAGEGEEKSKLLKLSKKLNISKNIVFGGWVKNVSSFLKKGNIFIISSKREGFPYSLIEAMGNSKAIIATDTPYGPREILVNGKYGKLVDVGNIKKLAKEMLSFSTNNAKYLKYAKLAFKRSKDFSIDQMLQKYEKVLLKQTKK